VKPDFVDRSPDAKLLGVLGADGFAAVREGGAWRSPVKGELSDPDWLSVSDEAEASNLSKEARAAFSVAS
jgi:hypothetical protein